MVTAGSSMPTTGNSIPVGLSLLLTVLGGVLVYIITKLIKRLLLDPSRSYKQLKARIAKELTVLSVYIYNPTSNTELTAEYKKASDTLRELSAEIKGFNVSLSWISRICGIPAYRTLEKVSSLFVGLACSLHGADAAKLRAENGDAHVQISAMLNLDKETKWIRNPLHGKAAEDFQLSNGRLRYKPRRHKCPPT